MLRYNYDNSSFYGCYNGFRGYVESDGAGATTLWDEKREVDKLYAALRNENCINGITKMDWDLFVLPKVQDAVQDVRETEGIFSAIREQGTQMTDVHGNPISSWLIDEETAIEILSPVAKRLTEEYRAKRIAELERAIERLEGKALPKDADVEQYEEAYARQNGFYLDIATQERLENGKAELAALKGKKN